MFGDISAWFYESLAGIRPDPVVPGFKKIVIKPAIVGDLTWVKAGHISPYGKIVSGWKLDGKTLTLNVEIPPNTTAMVYLPAKDEASVTESGVPAAKSNGVKSRGMEGACVVYEIDSGAFVFTSTLK